MLALIASFQSGILPTLRQFTGRYRRRPTVALLLGTFDNPDDPALTVEGHAFDDMAPAWWRRRLETRETD